MVRSSIWCDGSHVLLEGEGKQQDGADKRCDTDQIRDPEREELRKRWAAKKLGETEANVSIS